MGVFRRRNTVSKSLKHLISGARYPPQIEGIGLTGVNKLITQLNTLLKATLSESLGMEIIECSERRLVATMPVDSRTHQVVGLLHGGASVALAETMASLGGYYLVASDGLTVVGQEINANHLRAVTQVK